MAWTTDVTIDTPTNGNLTLNGAITSGNNLFKLDAGTLTLVGTNAVESMDINGGTNMITGNTTLNGNGVGYDRFYLGDGDYHCQWLQRHARSSSPGRCSPSPATLMTPS